MPDPHDEPDNDLARDVYAHFGLCMYMAQVFETGMINILTTVENAKSGNATAQNFDRLYEKNETLTFGNLTKALSKYNIVPTSLLEEARKLKDERDHLAHRFFREHTLDHATVAGSELMIQLLTERRERFSALDKKISRILDDVYEKALGSPEAFRKHVESVSNEMRAEAIAKARKGK